MLTPGKRSKVAPRLGEAVFFYVRCFFNEFLHKSRAWDHSGAILGPSWNHPGAILAPQRPSRGLLASSWRLLGPLWAPFKPSWGLLGPSWGHLKPFWGHLGASWSHLGASWELLGAILGSSRSHCTAETKTKDFPTII